MSTTVLDAFHMSPNLIFTSTLQDRYFYHHSTVEETETQRYKLTCKSESKGVCLLVFPSRAGTLVTYPPGDINTLHWVLPLFWSYCAGRLHPVDSLLHGHLWEVSSPLRQLSGHHQLVVMPLYDLLGLSVKWI